MSDLVYAQREIDNLINLLADARTENMRLNEYIKRQAMDILLCKSGNDTLHEENTRLRAALESVMIGGNSLAQIIGADHPPHGTPYSEAPAHYGGGVKYEAWCCWNTIMQARAALEEGRT